MKLNFFFIVLLFINITSCTDDYKVPINRKSIYQGEYCYLIEAISDNDTDEIEQLVTKYKLDVNHRDSIYGITLLEWALANLKKKAFNKLLNMGADPNFRDSITKTPVITMAAGQPDIDYLQSCLGHKGDPNIISIVDEKNGNRYLIPLDAAANGKVNNINLLVKYGADVNLSIDSSVVLTSALILDLEAAYALLRHGANPMKVKLPVLTTTDTLGICQVLRNREENIPGDDYDIKMAIVKNLKEKYNLNYFSTLIPEAVKKMHDSIYLNKY